MEKEFIISAVGRNVTGIVAMVSRAIYRSGCNFEDSRMTLLGNHFTLMILVKATSEEMSADLTAACRQLQDTEDLSIKLFPLDSRDHADIRRSEPNYEIRVKGDDRMGIVYRTSQLLASLNVNIAELETQVQYRKKDGTPVFNMRCRVVVPRELDGEALRKELRFLAEDLREVISLTRLGIG